MLLGGLCHSVLAQASYLFCGTVPCPTDPLPQRLMSIGPSVLLNMKGRNFQKADEAKFQGFLLLGPLWGLHLTGLLILYSFSGVGGRGGGRSAHHTGSGHPKTGSLTLFRSATWSPGQMLCSCLRQGEGERRRGS